MMEEDFEHRAQENLPKPANRRLREAEEKPVDAIL